MKKNILTISSMVLALGAMVTSCTKDFTKINTDPNTTPYAEANQLLAPALVNTLTYNQLRNRNYNNELMQVTVDMNDGEGMVFRYDVRASLADYLYNGWYAQLTNFKDIYKIASDPKRANTALQGISLICQSWVYSMLTDTYGDVPYFQSNLARDSGILEPRFDKQKDIYMDIFSKLEQANTLLKSAGNINAASDPVYKGNAQNWRKFGNSLYLRLLLRVSGKAEVTDTCVKKILQITGSAANYPVFTSNAESAVLRWTGSAPYASPLIAVREQDYRSPAIASFFIDNLNKWNDPRIDIPTYGVSGINRWGIAPASGVFAGVPSGYSAVENPVKKAYFYSTTSARTLQNDSLTGILMNYAELQFIMAELAARSWITGSAETYFTNAVDASIKYWIPAWSKDVKTYLAEGDIEWDNSGTLEDKLEQIHLQKYYALFMVDLEQWFEYRRTGHPVLPKGAGLKNNGEMPSRSIYPVYVQSTNPTNYKKAVAEQGEDRISTKVWWQKP
ncbi:hypothetical protein HNQ91_001903 [Filimonas zeae]|uniref:Starch-binding associating with outer membrane n=1 Tax=Filimonas zeae TaxID=1737353 RepID=A0A917MX90_9BACT|nr:SusD/RagB family nutrient-binding outer membrane lipoprotein [Filimonas zeae]MDR6338852.1 hypothetical protein [Filimonas zeae]GGH66291.1 hypothetical protein GCM10011379_20320 [Filimonas zeae]